MSVAPLCAGAELFQPRLPDELSQRDDSRFSRISADKTECLSPGRAIHGFSVANALAVRQTGPRPVAVELLASLRPPR